MTTTPLSNIHTRRTGAQLGALIRDLTDSGDLATITLTTGRMFCGQIAEVSLERNGFGLVLFQAGRRTPLFRSAYIHDLYAGVPRRRVTA